MNCLLSPPVFSGYNGSPDTCFSPETTRLMSWPDGGRYLRPPQSLVVSLLLSLVSTLLFFRTGGILPHRNSLKQTFPQFPPKNLCSLVRLAVFYCVLAVFSSTLQRIQPTVKLLSLQDWQNQESSLQRLWTLVPGHLSSCLHCPATDFLYLPFFGDSLSLFDP